MGKDNLQRAIEDGHIEIRQVGTQQVIHYRIPKHAHKDRFDDPEESVRARFFADLIYEYGYHPKFIGLEIKIPDRLPKDSADLILFSDEGHKTPFLVVECKRPNISDAELQQAVEQAFGNGNAHKFRATYVGVVSGETKQFYDCSDKYGALERELNRVADLPREFGRPPEAKYTNGGELDLRVVPKEELITILERCHQSLWAGGKLSPPEAFDEFSKLVFIKIRDELDTADGEPYQFQIRTSEDATKLARRIRDRYTELHEENRSILGDALRVDDHALRMCVSHLQGVNLAATDPDTKGLAFEKFMDKFFKGDFGQYFTPREIIRFAVAALQPSRQSKILDPACGSGGFLLHSLDEIHRQAIARHRKIAAQDREVRDFAAKKLFGIEINQQIARVARMNMLLHGDGQTNILAADALDKLDKLERRLDGLKRGGFDMVLTNPPFGASVRLDERGQDYANDWDLLQTETGGVRSSIKSEVLFLERIEEFLVEGGRAAVILPDGVLSNSTLAFARTWLLAHFDILAIISLPQSAFVAYGAAVKSSLVLLRKTGEKIKDDAPTFVAIAENIGFDATGRDTHVETVLELAPEGLQRVVRRESDLLVEEVTQMRGTSDAGWHDRHSTIDTTKGLLGELLRFFNGVGKR